MSEQVQIDAVEFAKLRAGAAVGIVDRARQLVAAAVDDGRIAAGRAKFWQAQIVRHGAGAEAALSALTPVAGEAPDAAGPRWFH